MIPCLSHLKTNETNKKIKEAPSKDIAINSEVEKGNQQKGKRQN